MLIAILVMYLLVYFMKGILYILFLQIIAILNLLIKAAEGAAKWIICGGIALIVNGIAALIDG